jgi:Secretion system C-terminal sorting domain/Lectin C-type domain
MKNLITFILGLIISNFVMAQCADTANIYTFSYGGHTYEVVKEMKNWTTAAACAVERGGYLVEINDQAENDAVYSGITTGAGVSTTYTTVGDGGGIAYVWIGASDITTEGTWIWDGNGSGSGTSFWSGQGNAGTGGGIAVGGLYNNWGGSGSGTPNEPDNYGNNQDGGAIALDGWPGGTGSLGIAKEWNDIATTNNLYFVIEIVNANISENTKKNSFKLYPNPAESTITIETEGESHLSIYSVSGEKLYENTIFETQSISIEGYASGVYFVKETKESNINVQKLIVN